MKKERPTGKSVVLFSYRIRVVRGNRGRCSPVRRCAPGTFLRRTPSADRLQGKKKYVTAIPIVRGRLRTRHGPDESADRQLPSAAFRPRIVSTGIVRRVTGPETPLRSSESETERPSPTRIPENRKEARIRRLSAPETTPSKKRSARKRKRPETTIRIHRTALRVHAFPNESQKRTDTPKPTVPAA